VAGAFSAASCLYAFALRCHPDRGRLSADEGPAVSFFPALDDTLFIFAGREFSAAGAPKVSPEREHDQDVQEGRGFIPSAKENSNSFLYRLRCLTRASIRLAVLPRYPASGRKISN
jgi:hypothetical protein